MGRRADPAEQRLQPRNPLPNRLQALSRPDARDGGARLSRRLPEPWWLRPAARRRPAAGVSVGRPAPRDDGDATGRRRRRLLAAVCSGWLSSAGRRPRLRTILAIAVQVGLGIGKPEGRLFVALAVRLAVLASRLAIVAVAAILVLVVAVPSLRRSAAAGASAPAPRRRCGNSARRAGEGSRCGRGRRKPGRRGRAGVFLCDMKRRPRIFTSGPLLSYDRVRGLAPSGFVRACACFAVLASSTVLFLPPNGPRIHSLSRLSRAMAALPGNPIRSRHRGTGIWPLSTLTHPVKVSRAGVPAKLGPSVRLANGPNRRTISTIALRRLGMSPSPRCHRPPPVTAAMDLARFLRRADRIRFAIDFQVKI